VLSCFAFTARLIWSGYFARLGWGLAAGPVWLRRRRLGRLRSAGAVDCLALDCGRLRRGRLWHGGGAWRAASGDCDAGFKGATAYFVSPYDAR